MTDSSQSAIDTQSADAPPPGVLYEAQNTRRFVRLGDLLLEYRYWTNPRSHTGLGAGDIQELGESIKTGTVSDATDGVAVVAGIRVSLEVVQIKENGGVAELVIDGQRRVMGARAAGLPPDTLVPVIDLEPEPVEWTRALAVRYLLRALENVTTRAGLSSYELAMNAKQLRDSKDPDTGKDYTMAKISGAIGRSESWVSRILAAMGAASPKLMHRWQIGELTDEQFKDAATVKDRGAQEAVADKVVEARAAGDRGEARAVAKEQRELAKQAERPARKTEPPVSRPADVPTSSTAKTVVRGPQQEIPAPPTARKPPSRAVIEDVLEVALKRPPTHDLVKGVILGIRWTQGLTDLADFPRAWHQYVTRVHAKESGKPSKTASKARSQAPTRAKRKATKATKARRR